MHYFVQHKFVTPMEQTTTFIAGEQKTFSLYPAFSVSGYFHSDFVVLLNSLTVEQRWVFLESLEVVLQYQTAGYVYEFTRLITPLVYKELMHEDFESSWRSSPSAFSFVYEYACMVDVAIDQSLKTVDISDVCVVEVVRPPPRKPKVSVRVYRTIMKKRPVRRQTLQLEVPYVLVSQIRPVKSQVNSQRFTSVSALVSSMFRNVLRSVCKETREPRRVWGAKQARAHHFRSRVLVAQSGRPVATGNKRDERDSIQRAARVAKDTAAKKAVPKELRERRTLDARDKRSPVWRRDACDPELQSGHAFRSVCAAGIGILSAELWRTLRSGRKASDAFTQLTKQLTDFKSTLTRVVGKALWAVPFVCTVFYAVQHFGVANDALMALIMTVCSTLVGKHIWEHAAKFFRGCGVANNSLTTQAGAVDMMPRLLSTIMCFSVFGRKFSPSTVTEFVKRLSSLDRLAAGWETFLRWLLEGVESLVNFVRQRFGKQKVKLFNSVHKPTYEWAARVDKLVLEHSTAAKDVDPEGLNEMVKLIREGHGFKELYRGTTMSRYVDEYTMRASNLLQPYLGTINARNNFRFEPIACMLLGAPGVGKTILAVPMCAAVLIESGLIPRDTKPDVVIENIWQKGTSEYWNSYASQLCLVMDDAFQQRADPTDKDNEYMNLIRMVGSWSFPLNFADLTSKGKIFFGSKFIFGTTNLRSFNAEAALVIQEPQAVARRLNFSYELRIKPEYALNGRLDQDAYQRECEKCAETEKGLDRFPWYMWEVFRHDFITGSTDVVGKPVRDLVLEMAQSLKDRSRTFTATKSYLTDFISGMNDSVSVQAGRSIELLNLGVFNKALCSFVKEQRILSSLAMTFLKVVSVGLMAKLVFDLLRVVLGTVWNFFSGLFGSKKKEVVQSNRPLARRAQKMKDNDIRLQSTDSNVCSNVYANTYKMIVYLVGDQPFVMGQVCFLEDVLAVQPEHFSASVKEMVRSKQLALDSKVRFKHAVNNDHSFEMSVKRYLSFSRNTLADMDVEFLKFEDVRAHRNITGSFMRETDLKYLGGVRGRIDICEVDDRHTFLDKVQRNVYTFPTIRYGTQLRFGNRKLNRYFNYAAPTEVGDCGAPLCVFDNSSFSGRTAIGLHVSGNTSRSEAYSSIITQEMIADAKSALAIIQDNFELDLADRGIVLQSGGDLPFDKQGSFLPIGVVDRPVVICPKTSFYPTRHFGSIGEYEQMPAPLAPVWRDGVLVYPMENAVSPYSSPVYLYEQAWLKQAMHVTMAPVTHMTKDFSRRIYTFEEAVCGVPQEKFRSIPRGTASGFPYVYDVRNGKKEFFGEGQEYDLTTKHALILRERVHYVLNSAKKGVRLSHVFLDFLKDELRSPEKVQNVATRLISSAPLDYTIAWRMYFGAFSSAVMRVHTTSGMAPGICTYTEWDKLADMLSKKGTKVFDGDFKGFDSSEQPTIHNLILDAVNKWYDDGEENSLVRKVLWLELMHSRHIGGLGKDQRYVYQWNKSLPSGHPFTTIVNSIYSLFTIVGAYISTTGDLVGFWNKVSTVTYGDDNVTNVADDVAELFNQVTVAAALSKEFKLVYTSGKKDGKYEPYTTLTEVSFLKRHIVDRGGWICPLELESFLYTFYWCKNRKLEDKIFHDVLETALEELSMHNAHVWDEYAPKLYRLLTEAGHMPAAPCEQNSYLDVIKSRGDNWY